MNTTPIWRSVATTAASVIIAITATTTITGTAASASAGQRDTSHDRPCFMVRPNWNNAEGPQPTCRIPMWQQNAATDNSVATRPAASARIKDFMP